MRHTFAAAALGLALAAGAVQAQVVSPPLPGTAGGPGLSRLFSTGSVSGNGADLTEDALSTCSYTMPAGMLANAGDTIHIRAAGAFGATTDAKTARVRVGGVGGTSIASATSGVVAGVNWAMDVYMVKTGASTQSVGVIGVATATLSSPRSTTAAITDTSSQVIVVTGQNATNSVLNSVTCQVMTVNFEH